MHCALVKQTHLFKCSALHHKPSHKHWKTGPGVHAAKTRHTSFASSASFMAIVEGWILKRLVHFWGWAVETGDSRRPSGWCLNLSPIYPHHLLPIKTRIYIHFQGSIHHLCVSGSGRLTLDDLSEQMKVKSHCSNIQRCLETISVFQRKCMTAALWSTLANALLKKQFIQQYLLCFPLKIAKHP